MTYTVMVGAGGQTLVLAGAGLTGLVAWFWIEVRVNGFLALFARGLTSHRRDA